MPTAHFDSTSKAMVQLHTKCLWRIYPILLHVSLLCIVLSNAGVWYCNGSYQKVVIRHHVKLKTSVTAQHWTVPKAFVDSCPRFGLDLEQSSCAVYTKWARLVSWWLRGWLRNKMIGEELRWLPKCMELIIIFSNCNCKDALLHRLAWINQHRCSEKLYANSVPVPFYRQH
jgi:hypothetical protein